MDAMVDLTNDLGVAILQDYSHARSNFAFSPYGLASVLVVLYEGAMGESARQIHVAAKFPWDRDVTRIGFRDIHRHLRSYFSHEGYLSGITLNKDRSTLNSEYKRVLRFYGYDVDVEAPKPTPAQPGGVQKPTPTKPTGGQTPMMEVPIITAPPKTTTRPPGVFTITSIPTTIGSEVTLNSSAFPGKEEITEQTVILNMKEEEISTQPSTSTPKPTELPKETTTKTSGDATTTVVATTDGFLPSTEVTKVEEGITSVVGATESVVSQSGEIVTENVTSVTSMEGVTQGVTTLGGVLDNGMLVPQPVPATTDSPNQATTDPIESNDITQNTIVTESRPSIQTSSFVTGTLKTTNLPKLSTYKTEPTENTLVEGREADEILLATETNVPESSTSEEFTPKDRQEVFSPTGSSLFEEVSATTKRVEIRTEGEEAGAGTDYARTTTEDVEEGGTESGVTRPSVSGNDGLITTKQPSVEEITETERSSVQEPTVNPIETREGEDFLPEVLQEVTTSFSLLNPTTVISESRPEVTVPDFPGTTVATPAEEVVSEEVPSTEKEGTLPKVRQDGQTTESELLGTTEAEEVTQEKVEELSGTEKENGSLPGVTQEALENAVLELLGTTKESSSDQAEKIFDEREVVKRSTEHWQIRTLDEYLLSSDQANNPQQPPLRELVLPKQPLFVPHTLDEFLLSKDQEEGAEVEEDVLFVPRTLEEYLLLKREREVLTTPPIKFTTELAFKKFTPSRKTRTIVDMLHLPAVPDLSLQLQNGMFDSHVSRRAELYRPLPRQSFLVDSVSDTPVPVMTYTNVFPYAYIPRLHSTALVFPLDDERYKLLLILPMERRGLRQLTYDLSAVTLRGVLDALRPTRVKATVPTFMVEGFVILTPALQRLGVWDVFDPRRANLTGMSEDPDLYVRNVEQSVTVVIRNYVEILDIQTRTMAARGVEHEFIATHPFLYFVMDTETNVSLMAGQMLDPLNSRVY